MQVREWMSPDPLTVERGTNIDEVLRLITERGIRHVPVVDGSGALVGMLSDRDVMGAARDDTVDDETTAAGVMSSPVHTVAADASIAEAARTMLSRRINGVAVVEDDKLVGLVTSSDCLLALLETEHRPVGDMTKRPENVSGLAPIDVDRCMELLATQSIGRLGFIRDGHPEVLPLNYRWQLGAIILRIGYGSLLETVHRHTVAFEVDGADEDDNRWSVVIRGQAEEVWQADEIAELDKLGLRPWAPGRKDHYVRILPTKISGRMIA